MCITVYLTELLILRFNMAEIVFYKTDIGLGPTYMTIKPFTITIKNQQFGKVSQLALLNGWKHSANRILRYAYDYADRCLSIIFIAEQSSLKFVFQHSADKLI